MALDEVSPLAELVNETTPVCREIRQVRNEVKMRIYDTDDEKVQAFDTTEYEPEPITGTELTPKLIIGTELTPEPITGMELTPEPITGMELTPEPITGIESIPNPITAISELEPIIGTESIPEPASEPELELPTKQAQEKELAVVRRRSRRVKAYLSAVLAIVIVMAVGTGAWYVISSHREVDTNEQEVMTPYFLYLLDPKSSANLQLAMGDLHPGETKREVICVSSKDPDAVSSRDIAKNINFAYELELAYTENLPVDYAVYQLDPAESGTDDPNAVKLYNEAGTEIKAFTRHANRLTPGEDETERRREEMYGTEQEGIVNLGQYVTYDKGGDGETLELCAEILDNDDVEYELDYYLIEVTWKNGIQFKDYLKETDLCYVIVKALQPRPEEKTDN